MRKEILGYAVKRWELKELAPIYEKDSRGVYRAESGIFGPVILKCNLHREELAGEVHVLEQMGGGSYCRLYAYEEDMGLLLEERLAPGTALRQMEAPEERAACFWKVFDSIHEEPDGSYHYDTYLDWLQRADGYCRTHSVDRTLAEKMHRGLEIGEKLFALYPDRVLLHGDLHHDNILQNAQRGCTAIDPKGVIGPAVFDLPRYLLNEFGYVEPLETEKAVSHLEPIINFLSERAGCPKAHVEDLLYMEIMLENVWSVEDGFAPEWQEIEAVEALLWRNFEER